MPATPFHAAPVWLLWAKWPRRLDFVGLTVGSIIPDLFEVLFFFGLFRAGEPGLPGSLWERTLDWTHSLLGAVTVDAAVAVAATVLLVRPLLVRMDRAWPSGLWRNFAGHDILARRSWRVLVASVWLGTLSHVLLDAPFHAMFRLFYPAQNVLLYHWDLDLLAFVVADLLVAPLFFYLLYVHWWRPSRSPSRMRKAGTRPN